MTERSESERAELVAELKEFLDRSCINDNAMTFLRKVETALRSLAAQDQKPVALAHVRLEDDGLFADLEVLDGTNLQPSMLPVALYLSPPPAAGWNESIEACKKVAEKWLESFMGGEVYVVRSIVNAIEALRTTPAATKSADVGGGARVKPLKWRGPLESFPSTIWEAKTAFGHYVIEEVSASDCPAYEVRLLMSFVAVKDTVDEAEAAAQADYAQRILSALSNPAAADSNASAEARLREALRDLVALVSTDSRYDDSESLRSARNILFAENKAAMLALSAHPHASDCDKTTYDVLGDQRTCVGVPASGIAKMMDAVENPKQPNEALKKLMRDHASDCDKQGER